jgi:acyl-ACP thioesterase
VSLEAVPSPTGRVYEQRVRAGLADAGPTGRVRLDALARWLQDVAWADVDDAGLADRVAWVVRRMRLRVDAFPAFGERLELRTWCTGFGRMWAERTTTVMGSAAAVEAVAVWVSLDPVTGRPKALDQPFVDVYGEAAAGRTVKARLHHPAPPADAAAAPWLFRRADLDVADHVNNAAYWAPVEEALLAREDLGALEAEVEFRGGADAGPATVLHAGDHWWITQPAGQVAASLSVVER